MVNGVVGRYSKSPTLARSTTCLIQALPLRVHPSGPLCAHPSESSTTDPQQAFPRRSALEESDAGMLTPMSRSGLAVVRTSVGVFDHRPTTDIPSQVGTRRVRRWLEHPYASLRPCRCAHIRRGLRPPTYNRHFPVGRYSKSPTLARSPTCHVQALPVCAYPSGSSTTDLQQAFTCRSSLEDSDAGTFNHMPHSCLSVLRTSVGVFDHRPTTGLPS